MMKKKISASFIVFLIAAFVTTVTFVAASLFSFYHVDKKNAIYLGASQSTILVLCPLSIYVGIKSKGTRFNKTGLWGSVAILTYTLALIVWSLIM